MKRLTYILAGFVCIAALLFSCSPEDDPNANNIPTTDSLMLRYTDTTTLVAIVERDDTLRTDATERVLLGTYHDPVFGQTRASFYSTFTIAQSFISNDTMVIDSIILTMRADGGYGDLSKFTGYQVLQVFEVTEDIPTAPTEGYNSTTSFNYNPVPIATYGFAPQFFPLGTEPAAIRLKINPSFANRFFNETTINSTNVSSYIKGIYVKIDPTVETYQNIGQGGIAYFKLNSDVSNLKIYYHEGAQSRTLKFPMSSSSNRRINIFEHEYNLFSADPAFVSKLNNPNDTFSSDKLYIQSLEGTRIRVEMPYLSSYLDSGDVIVNQAELIIPVDPTQDMQLYKIPDNILTYTLSSAGKVILMDDIFYSYYDSYYNYTKQEYRVVITQYVQQILNGTASSNVFYIDIPVLAKYTDAYRIVINSVQHATKPLKLNLTYTRIPTS